MKIKNILHYLLLWAIAGATAHGQAVGSYTQGATTTRVAPTAAHAGSKATTSVHLLYVMPGTSYAASCNLVGATGAPSIVDITKFTDHIVVTISNGSRAIASGASEIDCLVTGASK
jgi:hypothetical protein